MITLTIKGPGVAMVEFNNCGADKVTLSVDGSAMADSTDAPVSQAFAVGNTASVELQAGDGAAINVIKVTMHCTGGLWVG